MVEWKVPKISKMASSRSGEKTYPDLTISNYFNEDSPYTEDPFRSITSIQPSDSIITDSQVTETTDCHNTSSVPTPDSPVALAEPDILTDDIHKRESDQSIAKPATNRLPAKFLRTQDQLNLEEVDRILAAWIPTEHAQQILLTKLRANDQFQLAQDKTTKPYIMMNDIQPDPVTELVYKLKGEAEVHKRRILNCSKVVHNLAGLAQLIKAECWRSALDLTGNLLTLAGPGDQNVQSFDRLITPETMKIWTCRVALLTKLKLYSIAEAECQAFGNLEAADLYHQFHNPKQSGTLVPFSLRLLYCSLPQYLGRSTETLDRLFYVKNLVRKMLYNLQHGLAEDGSSTFVSQARLDASLQLWNHRKLQILYKIASCFLNQKSYRLAIKTYEKILRLDPGNKVSTCSTLARIFLCIGIKGGYEKYIRLSDEACSDPYLKQRLSSLHRGYMALAAGEYQSTPLIFLEATSNSQSYAVSKNNAAACMLYNGQLKSSLVLLEELIESDPFRYLQDTLLTNITTLYELESSDVHLKKQDLLLLANEHKGDGFNISSIKISS